MAMQLFTKKEFEAELKKLGLISTEHTFPTSRMWKTPKGRHISIPILPRGERYADWMLDEAIRQVDLIDSKDLP